jgi:ABC-type glutathione transport system ATPase component
MTQPTPDPLLSVRGLGKTFAPRRRWGESHSAAPALQDVSFTLARGRTLGVVGPSGSGKSTLARAIAFFDPPGEGEVWLEGRQLRRLEPAIQLIFQQPAASLNPRFTAAEVISEPLRIQNRGTAQDRQARAAELMKSVGLAPSSMDKRALEFSGGERQRLAIARALALEPRLLILDESFSGLDPEVQAQITLLLRELQHRLGLSYILISHDLGAVADLADEIAVMEQGRIIEHASTATLMAAPQHHRTRELLAAAVALGLRWGEGSPA